MPGIKFLAHSLSTLTLQLPFDRLGQPNWTDTKLREALAIDLDALWTLTSKYNLALYAEIAHQFDFHTALIKIVTTFFLIDAELVELALRHINVLTGLESQISGKHVARFLHLGLLNIIN